MKHVFGSGRNPLPVARDSTSTTHKPPEVRPAVNGRGLEVFTGEALEFVADLHRRFNPTRLDLLRRRGKRQARVDQGKPLDFSKATRRMRDDSWRIAPVPDDLMDRRAEIAAPPERKMMVTVPEPGARTDLAQFVDPKRPAQMNRAVWHVNLRRA